MASSDRDIAREQWDKASRRWGWFICVGSALEGASVAFLVANVFWPGVVCGFAAAASLIAMREWSRRTNIRLRSLISTERTSVGNPTDTVVS